MTTGRGCLRPELTEPGLRHLTFHEVLERLDDGLDPLADLFIEPPVAPANAVGAPTPPRPRDSLGVVGSQPRGTGRTRAARRLAPAGRPVPELPAACIAGPGSRGSEIARMFVDDVVESTARHATVVVIGAGQAGLSAAYHLKKQGFASELTEPSGSRTFVVLDREAGPGGAWQHRWPSLRMATVNGIFDLPGYPKPPIDDLEASRDAVPRYFAGFEDHFDLPIQRPVHVAAVRAADADPHGDLIIETDRGQWRTRALINATGTWTNPLLPYYPGSETFIGRQLHTWQYTNAKEFTGKRVAIVGGGISAIQQLEEISRYATTFWYTRREPVFLANDFRPEDGVAVVQKVADDVGAGLPSGSIVSYTGLPWTSYALAARDRGALRRRPMFTAIEPLGIREADGTFTSADVILWATGFRPAVAHLEPLHLQNELGGIRMRGTQVAAEPRVHLVGFGPSQSTVGGNRAGRSAVREVTARLDQPAPLLPVGN